MKNNIPYYSVSSPYDLVYRNSGSSTPVGPHTHNGAEIYLTLSPLPDVLLNNTVQEVPAGTLIIIPPFCIHQLYHEPNRIYERFILSINVEWLTSVLYEDDALFSYLKQADAPLLLSLSDVQLQVLLEDLNQFLTVSSARTPAAMAGFFHLLAELDQLITRLLPTVMTQSSHISATQQSVNDMIAYIHAHITENLTVAALAAHFYLHPDYLSRLFKQHTHTTVKQYITLQKITKAQMLLQQGWSVSQVQEYLGFSSYAHFFKTFQKITDTTPSRYREQARE